MCQAWCGSLGRRRGGRRGCHAEPVTTGDAARPTWHEDLIAREPIFDHPEFVWDEASCDVEIAPAFTEIAASGCGRAARRSSRSCSGVWPGRTRPRWSGLPHRERARHRPDRGPAVGAVHPARLGPGHSQGHAVPQEQHRVAGRVPSGHRRRGCHTRTRRPFRADPRVTHVHVRICRIGYRAPVGVQPRRIDGCRHSSFGVRVARSSRNARMTR